MVRRDISLKEYAAQLTKGGGVAPCIKLHEKDGWIRYARTMYGGARHRGDHDHARRAGRASADFIG